MVINWMTLVPQHQHQTLLKPRLVPAPRLLFVRTKKPGRVDAKPGFRSAVSAPMVAVSSTLGAYTGSTRYAPQRHHLHQTCLRWQFLGFLWLIPNPIALR